MEDPKCLLVLCGKVALPNSVVSKAAQTVAQCHATIETSGHTHTTSLDESMVERDQSVAMEGEPDDCASGYSVVPDLSSNFQDFFSARLRYHVADSHGSIIFHHNRLSAQPSSFVCETEGGMDGCVVPMAISGDSSQDTSPMEHQDVSTLMQQLLTVECSPSTSSQCCEGQDHEELMCQSQDGNMLQILHDPVGQNNYDVEQERRGHLQAMSCGSIVHAALSGQMDVVTGPNVRVMSRRFPTKEEHENQLARRVRGDIEYVQVPEGSPSLSAAAGDNESHSDPPADQKLPERNGEESETTDEGDSDEDLYENDDPIVLPLNVEDHSSEFGCIELETLSLVNVNLNDQVCAILLQSLPNLRNLNLSDTDICNPWRLLEPSCSTHLRLLQHLDVKSTALSRTALEMIPKFHPDLRKFSISSTTLPPQMYENIGKLTGVADLELIGGQFYPCEPVEIFEKGITPVINAIGVHLQSLNLSYFAHVSFEVIVTNCPRIEHLDLSRTRISVSCPCVSLGDCCPQLVSLNLGSSSIDAKEKQGSEMRPVSAERALEMMLGQPKMLEELDVSGQAITDETVKSIFPDEVHHPLSTLDLSRCHHVTIAGVQHIWEQCPHLRRIDLSHCRQVTQPDFENFRKGCHQSRPLFEREGKLVWS